LCPSPISAETPFARAIAIRGDQTLFLRVVDLRQAHHRGVHAALPERNSGHLGYAGKGWRRKRRIVLRGGAPLGHSDSGADNERTAGTLKHISNSFNGAFVELTAFRKLRPIVPKRDVKDGIGRSGTAAEAFQVFQITALYLSPGCGQRLGARIAASKTEHLVTCADQFRDDPGTDESCCTCHENTHRNLLYLFTARIDEEQLPD
jgi:hypothetical protein